jgi:hypothetical protein
MKDQDRRSKIEQCSSRSRSLSLLVQNWGCSPGLLYSSSKANPARPDSLTVVGN